MFNDIKSVIFHKNSKLSHIQYALQLLELIESDLDFSLSDEIKTLKYFGTKRLDGYKYAEIIHDVVSQKEELITEIEHINKAISDEDLESILHAIKIQINQYKLNKVLEELKKGLTDLELDSFPSFTEKANIAKSIVSNAFEKLAEINTEKQDNLFIIDSDIDIEDQIEDDNDELTISTGFKSLDDKILGYKSARLYLFMGGTGKGKSLILMNATYQIAINYKHSDYRTFIETAFLSYPH